MNCINKSMFNNILYVIIIISTGCSQFTQEQRLIPPVIDSKTKQQLPETTVLGIVQSTDWHFYEDPLKSPFKNMNSLQLWSYNSQTEQNTLELSSTTRGFILFFGKHQESFFLIFSPGYNVGISGHPWASWTNPTGNKLQPINDGTEVNYGNFVFALQQQKIWSDLQKRYKNGQDVESIKLICKTIANIERYPISNEAQARLTKKGKVILEWCRSIAAE